MDGSQVGILEQGDKVGLGSLLERHHSRCIRCIDQRTNHLDKSSLTQAWCTLQHASQRTYKRDNQPTAPLKTPHSSRTTVARAFRSHLNLNLARLEQESSRADVVRTVGTPRRIRGHDPASAAVLVVGRCPWKSRSLAGLHGALWACRTHCGR